MKNSSSRYLKSCKSNFLILAETLTYYVFGSFEEPEVKLTNNFTKSRTAFGLILRYSGDIGCLWVSNIQVFKLICICYTLPNQFCLDTVSKYLSVNETK